MAASFHDQLVQTRDKKHSKNHPFFELWATLEHNGVVDKKFTLDKVLNDRILKQAQQELRKEGRLGQ